MVITTKDIMKGIKPILLVSHDYEDGMWEFLEGEELDDKKACIVSLDEILKTDSSLSSLHDLPLGWIAYRSGADGLWKRERIDG